MREVLRGIFGKRLEEKIVDPREKWVTEVNETLKDGGIIGVIGSELVGSSIDALNAVKVQCDIGWDSDEPNGFYVVITIPKDFGFVSAGNKHERYTPIGFGAVIDTADAFFKRKYEERGIDETAYLGLQALLAERRAWVSRMTQESS